MRALAFVSLVTALAVSAPPVAAQDAEALRKELEQMRQQFGTMKHEYQRAIDSMAQRLQRLEAAPAPVVGPAAVSQAAPAAVTAGGGEIEAAGGGSNTMRFMRFLPRNA